MVLYIKDTLDNDTHFYYQGKLRPVLMIFRVIVTPVSGKLRIRHKPQTRVRTQYHSQSQLKADYYEAKRGFLLSSNGVSPSGNAGVNETTMYNCFFSESKEADSL
jgi:hypothetical protein